MNSAIQFKRINVNAKFSYKGNNYRKIDKRHAFKLNENGRGQTHAKIEFSRSAHCELI